MTAVQLAALAISHAHRFIASPEFCATVVGVLAVGS